jgi:Fe-S-cluster containining protein
MDSASSQAAETVTIPVDLETPDWNLKTKVTVPTAPTRLRQMLPLVQVLSDRVVDATAQTLEVHGHKISCQKGCGACCRQLVPISEVEARHIHDLVEELPEPRRSEVRARFSQARERLQQAGLLDPLLSPEVWTDEVFLSLATRYFRLQIPCPFLEEESCSIHRERPITCREYLVTSPAENCAHPTPETIQRVHLPVRIFNALARFDVPRSRPFLESWVPLVVAPEWSETHPGEPPPRPGPELLRELLHHMRHQADGSDPAPAFSDNTKRASDPPRDNADQQMATKKESRPRLHKEVLEPITLPEVLSGAGAVTATVNLSSPDWELRSKITIPIGPTRLRQMLPLVQVLADRVVDAATESEESQGRKISCTKGCGACCRQLVPIAEVEARAIRDVIERLPESRRSEIRARFAAARQRLDEAGILDKLLHPEAWPEGDNREFGLDYFRLGIACPFLEEESCSIHPDRPIACREYLVTSPARNCAQPTPETVQCVKLPFKIWNALGRVDEPREASRFIRWVPLIVAPEWADAHPDEPALRPGPELLQKLLNEMTAKKASDDQPS